MGSTREVKPKPANPIWAWNHGARTLGTGSTFVCVVLQSALIFMVIFHKKKYLHNIYLRLSLRT